MNLNNLVQYCRINNLDDIFAGLSVPAPLNPAAVKSAIMVRCGLLTPVYNDPDTMRQLVADWFFQKQWTLQHVVKIIEAEYSPIENYDRYENSTDTHKGTVKDEGGGNDTHSGKDTNNLKIVNDTDAHTGTDTTTNTISAENSNVYSPDNKSELQHGETITYNKDDTTTITHGHKIDRTDHNTRTDDLTDKHESHMHGNIGIVTNQQMIEAELKLLEHFDAYRWIAEQFEKDFMIMLY